LTPEIQVESKHQVERAPFKPNGFSVRRARGTSGPQGLNKRPIFWPLGVGAGNTDGQEKKIIQKRLFFRFFNNQLPYFRRFLVRNARCVTEKSPFLPPFANDFPVRPFSGRFIRHDL
jgi:hypothetical protein